MELEEKEMLACCGSTQFAKEMTAVSPFPSIDEAISVARQIWFNKVDVNGWLQAFSAHPQIGQSPSSDRRAASISAQLLALLFHFSFSHLWDSCSETYMLRCCYLTNCT